MGGWMDSRRKETSTLPTLMVLFFKWKLFIQIVNVNLNPTSTLHFTVMAFSIMK